MSSISYALAIALHDAQGNTLSMASLAATAHGTRAAVPAETVSWLVTSNRVTEQTVAHGVGHPCIGLNAALSPVTPYWSNLVVRVQRKKSSVARLADHEVFERVGRLVGTLGNQAFRSDH